MAKYSAVKATVNAYIKQNGRKEITGRILNAVLNATIDSLGKYFQFAGGALPTDDPGTPDQNVCYLAGEPGVYTNFGGITIENEEVALLFWDGEWTKQRILIGIREVNASVDSQVGTPSVDVSYSGGELVLTFHNLKGDQGDTGDPAGFGTIGADINGGVGTPGVSVESSGDNTAKNLMFHFTNLKGETGVTSVVATIDNTSGTPSCQVSLVNGQLTLAFSGLKGLKGDTGVSADYPITIYNGLDSDATDQALAAAQGKVLDGKVSQLGQDSTVLDNLRFELPQKQNVLYELGNILIANTGWTYSSSTTRVRTPEDFILHLYPGDIVGLTSYTDARFYWGCRDMSGRYTSGGWKTEDVIVAKEGYFCILVCNLTDTTQTSAQALGSLINIRRNTNIGSVINTLKDISVGTISLYSAGHYYNDSGGYSSSANFNIYKATVKRGDYLCVTGSNSADIAVFSRTATNGVANRVDAFMLGAGSAVPVRYICEKDEDIFISTAVNAPFEIVHIKDRQRNTLMDSERENFEDISNIVQYQQGYVKYSDGSFNTTSSPLYVASFKSDGIKKVRVFVSAENTLGAAIAFYSSETIGSASYISGVQIGRNNGGGRWYEATVPNNAVLITSTNHRTYCPTAIIKVDSASALIINKAVDGSGVSTVKKTTAFAGGNPFRFNGPFYAHLFTDKIYETSTDIIIPSESLEDIRVSRRLGFNVIEANVQTTSDGKFIVIHGSGGKFGYEVTDLNGEFTYADTAFNSVTLDWIKENIRYRSDIPRYRTEIPTLEEFLRECRLQGMIPFCQASTQAMVSLLDEIMGYGNYFAYNGVRSLTKAPIVEYLSLTTKADILEHARSKGVPYVYLIANYNTFTEDELKDIVASLHAEGFMVGAAYVSSTNANYCRRLGFDMIASTWEVNNFDNANLCTLCSGVDWSDFQITGGVVTDAGVELGSSQSIVPATALQVEFLAKAMVQVAFTGTIILRCGKDDATISSDGTNAIIFSSYFINSAPAFQIIGTSAGATIKDVVFKASRC